ncbi:hypothetical protein J1N35_014549 [Gossypium stocksii]|uniref:Rotamase n=1 Tax=Gossypium stocksii TaxID=47602 RepID=A0A9D3VVH2_9ROSI|nr:hypothetical protein J1N35_014549 [Gossypium stocksii]
MVEIRKNRREESLQKKRREGPQAQPIDILLFPPLSLRKRGSLKVRVHYTGKLEESGQVFDSSVGKPHLKFRLGRLVNRDGGDVFYLNAGLCKMHAFLSWKFYVAITGGKKVQERP